MVSSTSALSETTDMRELRNPSTAVHIVPVPHLMSREERERELSVRTRTTPSYDPQHLRFGEFILAPSVEVFSKSSDNIYLTSRNQESDIVNIVRPELVVRSDFERHKLNTDFYYEDGKYRKIGEEDYQDYGASLDGSYDFYQGVSIPVKLGYQQDHSRREDPEDRRSIDPTVFKVTNGQTGFVINGHSLNVNMRTGFQSFAFDDTTSLTGTPIDNSDRDRTTWTNFASVGFPEEAILAPYLYAMHKKTSYDQTVDNFGISRDSHDMEGGVGTIVNFSDVTKSTFQVGRVKREFDSSTLDPISAYTYLLNLSWEPSALMAFSLSGQRQIKETATIASAKIESSLILSMLYELAPNVMVQPKLAYINRDYKQSTDYKTIDYEAGIGTVYKLNPNIWTTLEYKYRTEDATGSAVTSGGYNDNAITFSLKFQL